MSIEAPTLHFSQSNVELLSYMENLDIQHLREIIAYNSDWIWEVDAQGRYTFCSEHSRQLLGYAPAEMLGRTPFDFMPAEEAERVAKEFAAIVEQQRSFAGLINRNLHADGRMVVLETSGIPLFAPDGTFAGYRGIDRDISPATGPLSVRAVQLEALYAAAPIALGLVDRDGRFVNANHALAEILESSAERLTGTAVDAHLPATVLDVSQCFAQLSLGRTVSEMELNWKGRAFQVSFRAVLDAAGLVTGMTLAFADITEQTRMRQLLADTNAQLEAANARLRQLAGLDHLTGIANRRRFDEVLLREVTRALREGMPLSLLMIDVDSFKAFNDHYGHQSGDERLSQIARLLSSGLFRPADLACRYGGEEFAVILPHTDAHSARTVAERLREMVYAAGLPHARTTIGKLTISVGVATFAAVHRGPDAQRPEKCASELVMVADRSLYEAKHAGRNRVYLAMPERT